MSDSVKKYFEIKQDRVVTDVLNRYKQRSEVGIKKYGTTLEDSKEDQKAFLIHLMEELMDATLYCQKTLKIMEEKNEEQKFMEARIEFLLEQLARLNNQNTLLGAQVHELKRQLDKANNLIIDLSKK